jgi:hypothetical protein
VNVSKDGVLGKLACRKALDALACKPVSNSSRVRVASGTRFLSMSVLGQATAPANRIANNRQIK